MGINDWLKRKMAILAIATSNVEKNALGGSKNVLTDGIGTQRYQESNRLSDGLMRGELTQQVLDLRWRMYKVLDAAKDYKSEITSIEQIGIHIKLNSSGKPILDDEGNEIPILDDEGNEIPIYRNVVSVTRVNAPIMSSYKIDSSDDYLLELIVENEKITSSVVAGMGNVNDVINEEKDVIKNSEHIECESKVLSQRSVGEISSDELNSILKEERLIHINREFPSKVNIENYTDKLYVRTINETEKLLEFYVSKYVDEFDKKTVFLISEIKKILKNPKSSNIIDITGVGFLTSTKTLGAWPNKIYEFNDVKFYKIVEFEGSYLIKFKANMLVAGEDIFEQYRMTELDEKYSTNAQKDIR